MRKVLGKPISHVIKTERRIDISHISNVNIVEAPNNDRKWFRVDTYDKGVHVWYSFSDENECVEVGFYSDYPEIIGYLSDYFAASCQECEGLCWMDFDKTFRERAYFIEIDVLNAKKGVREPYCVKVRKGYKSELRVH